MYFAKSRLLVGRLVEDAEIGEALWMIKRRAGFDADDVFFDQLLARTTFALS